MGLFNKSPAKKKLKEITGGFLLSNSFMEILKDNGLSAEEGYKIQSEVKSSIKSGDLDVDGVEIRVNFLISQYAKEKSNNSINGNLSKDEESSSFNHNSIDNDLSINEESSSFIYPNPSSTNSELKTLKFLINQEHNIKKCPSCGVVLLKEDNYCFKCGCLIEEQMELDNKFKDEYINSYLSSELIKENDLEIEDAPINSKFKKVEISYKSDNSSNLTIDKLSSKTIDSSLNEGSIGKNIKKSSKYQSSKEKSYDIGSYKLFTLEDYNQCKKDANNSYAISENKTNIGSKILSKSKNGDLNSKSKVNLENKSSKEELSELEKIYTKKTNNGYKSEEDELTKLENIYNKKVKANYTSNFKFAYVLYLNELFKHPTKKFKENYKDFYKATIAKLKKQAKEDGYIVEGSPLSTAKDATVKDIKKVLKKHDLKVSGRKNELIGRLGENLSNEELKKAFPKKSWEVTKEGLSFIESNKYVLYYHKNTSLHINISPEEFDSIFKSQYKEEDLYDLIISFLKERGNKFVKNKQWNDYIINLGILISVYGDYGDENILLDYYFKSLILSLNNYSPYVDKCEPGETCLDYQEIKDLVELMHTHSLDLSVLKERFKHNYDEIKLPYLEVSSEECFMFLLKAFSGEDLINLNSDFRVKYGGEAFKSGEVL